MQEFNTVDDLLKWNSTPPPQPKPLEKLTAQERAKVIAKEVNRVNEPDLNLHLARYLIGSLVSYHKRVVDMKREMEAPDTYIWTYDYANLNSALRCLEDVTGTIE
ncbi:hypothetical protein SCRM01_165c [Synechococcus phage S-CRM01]|uniref:hypothetical protein n=1 Tax=Synechococcus phage S-CRM01 TaxID=1026955 RepID=UPI000209E3F6|nr:hypothetical protein SCRM01_165c [Synechococcus phage S-CRM01]AEC53111.1 hypothetical protein SCRM01_165c [Synechococcus phage S-CRM01]